jgi:endonuclease IV
MSKQIRVIDSTEDFLDYIKDLHLDEAMLKIFDWFNVGSHIEKGVILSATLEKLSPNSCAQIFLTARSTKFKMSVAEKDMVREVVTRKRLRIFVHTPYLLNLATKEEYIVDSLRQHLEVSAQCGFKGCVVHVGKRKEREMSEALDTMRQNILKSIENASEDCPLLLETPAGQGTEMLTNCDDFMNFVDNIDSPKFGICVDTCHVFSSGILPCEYVRKILNNSKWKKYLKLFHFNDSERECSSCVDRHAPILFGQIPIFELINIAFIAQDRDIPLITE